MNEQEQLLSLSNQLKEIKRELFEEWKQKYPRPFLLEEISNKIIQLLKNVKIKNKDFEFWKSWTIKDLDILKEDLIGNLQNDFDKKLVRYRPKWIVEKEIIEKIIVDFNSKFVNKQV